MSSHVGPEVSATQAGVAVGVPARTVGRVSLAIALGVATAVGVALALAAAYHVPNTSTSPLYPDSRLWRVLLGIGVLGSFVAYVLSLLALRRRTAASAAVIGIAVAIQVAPLATPLLFSRDAYLYWDYGRQVLVHHADPYVAFPGQWPNDPAYRQMSTGWARLRSPYGPGWTLIGAADAKLAGDSPSVASGFYRVLAALSMLACVGLVAWSTRSAFATALVGWNPLLAFNFAGGGHPDALMMAFVAAGLALASRRPASAGASWAAAASVKAATLAFLGVEVVRRMRERNRRWFVGLGLGAVIALAIATSLFGLGWLHSGGAISNQLRETETRSLPGQIAALGLGTHPAQVVTAVLFAVLYLWILREAWHGRQRTSLAAGGLCLAVAWLMPWYAAWPVVLAAFDADLAGTVLALVLTGYLLLDIPGLSFTV
jgi:hypothetical protein